MEVTRYVNLTYTLAFLLAVVTFDKLVQAIWSSIDGLPHIGLLGNAVTLTDLVTVALSVALIVYLYRRQDYRQAVVDVILELRKVTWPTWDETKRGTFVVIVFTLVLSAFLWGSDQIWKYATDLILLPPGA